jgi:signal transduction histidine kinase/CheY-like chemotaxis protein
MSQPVVPNASAENDARTPEAERLLQLIRLNASVCTVAAPAMLLIGLYFRTPSVLAIAAMLGFTIWNMRIGIRHASENRVEQGITSLSIAVWIPALTTAIFAPDGWAVTVAFAVLAVLLAVPYVSARKVLQFIAVSTVILVIGGYFRVHPWLYAFPPNTPEAVSGLMVAVGSSIGALLCMFSVWQSNSRLVETLEETRESNQRLRDSERSLEQRVTRRTADLVESQRELALARDEALDANRTKSTFLANMSHELRTPLNAIIGYSELLKEDAEDDSQHQGEAEIVPDLDKILGAGNHLLGLINDILDLSKVEAGRMEIVREDFAVEALVDEIAASIEPIITRGDNVLEIADLSDAGSMQSDATKVRQILLNLLSNAAKFTEHGTIALEVERRDDGDGSWVEFRVRDSGIGMKPEQLDSIFEAFSQAEKTTQRDFGGTGLGLAISRRFCQLLGGEVSAESTLGEGTQFRVRLPAVVPMIAEEPVFESETVDLTSTSTPTPAADASVPTVLVIDDQADARDLLEKSLSRDGYRVVTTASGRRGLELAREVRPDVITLDIKMPEMDGWRVLSELKANALLAPIPVVLVTILEDRNLGYALGAAEFLTKPVSRERLSDVVRRYASRRASVLIVEDDAATRSLIARAVEAEGMRAVEAETGRHALDLLEGERPALILTDLMMPVMDGFELLAELRQRQALREIPVVVITAKDLTPEEHDHLAGRTEQVIEKDGRNHDDLLSEVRRHVRTAVDRSHEASAEQ